MKEFIEYLVKQIVSNPQAVFVDETLFEENILLFTINVAPEDIGVVIGRSGRNINSIRNMVKAKAIRDNIRIRIDIAGTERENVTDTSTEEPVTQDQ